ncbi:uncharacterized protein [Antedon mediterranea]|uniref:uncharacterized protein n=1 Tax=Antedon mediterranea TaxID=105859 RepID=UPI003AF4AA0C
MIVVYVISLIVGLFAGTVHGLTKAEIRKFVTKTHIEHNTGLQGTVSITSHRGVHTLVSNGIPDHDTGTYPSQHTPNSIIEQDYYYQFPRNPIVASESTALNQGPVGISINGIPFYNPWTNDGQNAVLGERFDDCDGHPDKRGRYHYHKMPSSCVFTVEEGVASTIIGVALDGFPIYGPIDEDGSRLRTTDLDECHGKHGTDGKYRYHVTDDFPYILGCYKGEVGN